jgi:hypothetical protein
MVEYGQKKVDVSYVKKIHILTNADAHTGTHAVLAM